MKKEKQARVFLIDSNRLFVEAFLLLCDWERKISVVGFSLTGREVLPELLKTKPNVVIVNTELSGINGTALVRTITAELGRAKVIALSLHDTPELAQKAFQSGASAFLVKGTPAWRILKTICQLANL